MIIMIVMPIMIILSKNDNEVVITAREPILRDHGSNGPNSEN